MLGCTSAQAQDLALNQPATASSTQGGLSQYRPTNANDGNSSTRWASDYANHEWWQVDLGSIRSINRVELNWEAAAYARQYRIRTRTSTSDSWSTAARATISTPGLKAHTFATRNARYVRVVGDIRATPWGVSLWDARVCNLSCAGPPAPPPDGDGDGVPDSTDRCPTQPGPRSNGGCPLSPGPPTAEFTINPSPSKPGEQVAFDWTGTCTASPCSLVWEDEGLDGPGGTDYPWGTGDPLLKTFQLAGTKYAHLVVTDSLGRTAEVRKQHQVEDAPPSPPPPSGACDLNATPSTFAAQVSAATTGQTICLASGDYGTWSGTSKAITIKRADGATPKMRYSFGSGDSGFTLDGMSGMSGDINAGASNITVRNSDFVDRAGFSGAMTNVVFDNNSHMNQFCPAGDWNMRLHLNSSGVTVKNSLFQGGDCDGVFISGNDNLVQNNRFINLCESGPNHTDGLQFADPGSPSGGYNTTVRGNFFSFTGCTNGYAQALTSYDSGTRGALIEDNVVDTKRPWGIELYSDDGSIVRHNTVRYYPDSQCVFSGLACGQIDVTRKASLADPPGTGTQVYDNVAVVHLGYGSTTARNDHNVSGQLVTYVGPLNTWSGFHLADGSVGVNAASDRLDVGIR